MSALQMDDELRDTRTPKQLKSLCLRLRRNTIRLRWLAYVVFLCTIANATGAFLGIASVYYGRFTFPLFAPVTLAVWCLLVWFESLRKEGDVYFEELSDSFEGKDPGVEIGVALKMHTRHSDLPLVPGRMGPLFYAAGNFVVVGLGIMFVGYMRGVSGY